MAQPRGWQECVPYSQTPVAVTEHQIFLFTVGLETTKKNIEIETKQGNPYWNDLPELSWKEPAFEDNSRGSIKNHKRRFQCE
ncbi:hypothetical protein Y1Q_0008861 [Alligator mississippiensis]|uniref:Uncharacterized protein n=1 Tax=Alligator mississippiensis TaxID=8496 RepID=A0A151NB65_ALLMI|nr:hypothetical protein Y1Q_0008861 [Alligator mississippiensis]